MNLKALLVPFWLALAFAALAQEHLPRSTSRSVAESSPALASGRKSYETHCAMCHGLDAKGGEHAPGIANSRDVQSRSDAALMQLIRQGIPAGGMPSFRSLPDGEIASIVKYLRSLAGTGGLQPVKGDPRAGERLFFGKAQCADCHMLAGKGGFVAPDLSDYALVHSPQEIREAILHPNETRGTAQQVVSVETVAGQKFSGLVRNQDNFSLQLQGMDGTYHMLMKSDIAKIEPTGRYLMPEDYGTRLSPTELDDLVSFIAHEGRHSETSNGSSGHHKRQ